MVQIFCVEHLMYSHLFRLDSGCNFSHANATSFLASCDVKILNSPVMDTLKLILNFSDFQSACLENKSHFPQKKDQIILIGRFQGRAVLKNLDVPF